MVYRKRIWLLVGGSANENGSLCDGSLLEAAYLWSDASVDVSTVSAWQGQVQCGEYCIRFVLVFWPHHRVIWRYIYLCVTNPLD